MSALRDETLNLNLLKLKKTDLIIRGQEIHDDS